MTALYAAYGSNLDHARMQARCPGAVPAGGLLLPGWRLVVRKYALILPDPAAACPVGLWRVTAAHLASLDRFEGHPVTYLRETIALPDGRSAWIYHERRDRPGPPAPEYVAHLRQGYRDFGFDAARLAAALG